MPHPSPLSASHDELQGGKFSRHASLGAGGGVAKAIGEGRKRCAALDSLSICLSPRCGGGSVSAVGEGWKGGVALDSLVFASAEKRKAEAERIRIKVRLRAG